GIGLADDIVPEHPRGAAVGAEQRGEHADGGGLAGAVRAEDAVDGSGTDREVDAVHGAGAAERLDEGGGLDGEGGEIGGRRRPKVTACTRPRVVEHARHSSGSSALEVKGVSGVAGPSARRAAAVSPALRLSDGAAPATSSAPPERHPAPGRKRTAP